MADIYKHLTYYINKRKAELDKAIEKQNWSQVIQLENYIAGLEFALAFLHQKEVKVKGA